MAQYLDGQAAAIDTRDKSRRYGMCDDGLLQA